MLKHLKENRDFTVVVTNTPKSAVSVRSGGIFHLKVGGAKSSGNAGDPMLGVAVSGGSRIYKRGGGGA